MPRLRSCRLSFESLERREVPAQLDSAFSGDGKQITAFGSGEFLDDRAAAVAVDGSDQVVVAGRAQSSRGDYDFALTRSTRGGNLDRRFGGDGRVTIPFNLGGADADVATGVAVDRVGRIVVAGYVERDDGNHDFAVARLTRTGELDRTFSGDGKVTVRFDLGGRLSDKANAVAIDAAGRIVVAGSAQLPGGNSDFAVARLTSAGLLDKSFDRDGRQTVRFDLAPRGVDEATALAIDARGRIVLAGSCEVDRTNYDYAAARLTPDGAWDRTFHRDGRQTIAFDADEFNTRYTDTASAVAIDRAGRIYLGGTYASATSTGDDDFGIVRLTADGDLDVTYGSEGFTEVSFDHLGDETYSNDEAYGMAIDRSGRLLIVGYAAALEGGSFVVSRLTPTGRADTTFARYGDQFVEFIPGEYRRDYAAAVAVDSEGRIVVAGSVERAAGGFDFGVARFVDD